MLSMDRGGQRSHCEASLPSLTLMHEPICFPWQKAHQNTTPCPPSNMSFSPFPPLLIYPSFFCLPFLLLVFLSISVFCLLNELFPRVVSSGMQSVSSQHHRQWVPLARERLMLWMIVNCLAISRGCERDKSTIKFDRLPPLPPPPLSSAASPVTSLNHSNFPSSFYLCCPHFLAPSSPSQFTLSSFCHFPFCYPNASSKVMRQKSYPCGVLYGFVPH